MTTIQNSAAEHSRNTQNRTPSAASVPPPLKGCGTEHSKGRDATEAQNTQTEGSTSIRTAAAARASMAAALKQRSIPFTQRLMENIQEYANGCWLWTGYRYSNGYAAMSWQGKQQLLHRLVYEQMIGPIPSGLQLDHLCRVRHCVNPEHLEPVSAQENTRRAMRLSCVNGHPFTPENTYIPSDGKRYCRECRRRRVREYQERKKGLQ